jgi:four helix bundle protein
MSLQIKDYEDLIAWQKARELTKVIYEATRKDSFSRDFGLIGQMQRASVSVMSNIAEGFQRGTTKEFIRFLITAKASCAELRSHIYVAYDAQYINAAEFNQIRGRAEEVIRIIGGLQASLRKKIIRR